MDIHVRLEHNEAVSGKRELLSAEASLLHLLKKIKTYKKSRKRELLYKNNFKKNISTIKSELKNIKETFPRETNIFHEKEKDREAERETIEEEKDEIIERELQDIKEKLEQLD